MCYSAEASFSVGAGLIASAVAIQRVNSVQKNEQPLAAIPLLFGAQQIAEGLVWLGVNGTVPSSVQVAATYLFATIAFFVWPIYSPWAMYRYERSDIRKFLLPIIALGVAVGTYTLYCFTIYSRLELSTVRIGQGHFSLLYDFEAPHAYGAIEYAYVAAATFGFFFTRNERIRWIVGPAFLLSFPVGKYLSTLPTFPSTWCFVAAVVSLGIFFFAFEEKRAVVRDLDDPNRLEECTRAQVS